MSTFTAKPTKRSITATRSRTVMSDDSMSQSNLSLCNDEDNHIPCFGIIDGNTDILSRVDGQWDEGQDEPSSEEDEEFLLGELRQLSKNLTNGHSKRKNQVCVTEASPTRKVSQKEFVAYYQKSVSRFLVKKESDLAKKRKEKEAIETSELKAKPSLISKPVNSNHIPLMDRMAIIKEKKEKELARLKKEKEEKELRELSELTFKPKINRAPGLNNVSNKRTSSPSGQLSSRMNTQSTQRDRSDGNLEDGFRPRINKNSRNIAQGIIEDSSKDVVERLYSQVPNGNSNNNGKKSEKKLQKMGSTKENRNDIPKNTSSSRRVTEEASILQDIENSSDDVNVNVNKFGVQQLKVPTIDLERYEQEQNNREKNRKEDDILNKIAAEISGVKKGSQGNQVVLDQLRHLLEMYSPNQDHEGTEQNFTSQGGNILTESLVGQENNKKSPAKKGAKKEVEIEEKKALSPAKKPNKENSRSKSQVSVPKKLEPKIEEPEEPLNDSNTNDELEIASIKQNLLDIQGNLNTLKESFQHFQSSQVIPEVKLKFLQSPRQDPQPRKASKSPKDQTQKSPLSSLAPSNITTPRDKKKSVSRDKTPVEQREQRQNARKTEEKGSSMVIQSGSQTPRRNPSETRSGNTSPISPFKNQGNQIVLLPSDGYAKKLSRNASMTNTNRSEKQPEVSTFGGLVTEKECQTPWTLDEITKKDQYNQQPVQQIEMSFAVKEKKPREEKLLKLEKVEVEVLEKIDEMDKSEIDREIEKIERDLNIKREEKIEKVEPVLIRIKENGDVSPSLKKFKDYEIFRLKDLDVDKPTRKGNREKSKGSRSRSRNKGNNDFGYQNSINMMSSHAKTNDGKGSAKSLKEIAQMTLMKFKGDARSSTQGSCNDFQRILPTFD